MNPNNIRYVGKVRWQFDELASTNDYARILSNEPGTSEGTAVLARRQTAGRGQMGAVWESAPDQNLTTSVVLFPRWLRADQQAGLGKMAALAVYDTIAHVTRRADIHIKWPNDLIISNKKVAGILIENSINGPFLSTSVVGIGINANQASFSASLIQASSIQQMTGQTTDIAFLADVLFEKMEYWYERLKSGAFTEIQEVYLSRLLGLHQPNWFTLPNAPEAPFEGIIRDVGDDGLLCVETNGDWRYFGVKEIKQRF